MFFFLLSNEYVEFYLNVELSGQKKQKPTSPNAFGILFKLAHCFVDQLGFLVILVIMVYQAMIVYPWVHQSLFVLFVRH